MKRWLRIFAPAGALAVVVLAGGAAMGNGAANAQRAVAPMAAPAAQQPAPTVAPTAAPQTGTQNGSQNEAQDATEAPGTETNDGAETPDNEAADAAALASQATITVDQAKATALAANPGTTVLKAELGDENGTIVYSVALSNGADVKVDANSGTITATDQPGSDNETNDGAETPDNETNDGTEAPDTTGATVTQ